MKTEMYIRGTNASLILTADSEFERDMFDRFAKLPGRHVEFNIEDSGYYNTSPKAASIVITSAHTSQESVA